MLKDSELKKLLAEVTEEVNSLIKTEATKLAKAAPDGDKDDVPPEASSAPAPEASSLAAPPDASASAPASDASAAAPDASAPAAPAAPADQPPPADPAADAGAPDVDALKAEYAKLAPDELKVHYIAAKAALFAAMGGGDQGASPSPSAPPAPEGSSAPAMKSEAPIAKSEPKADILKGEVDALRGQNDALKGQIETLANVMDKILAQPLRKAFTSVAHIPQVEEKKPLSKTEIQAKLSAKAKENLKKSDRDLINKFCVGTVGTAEIEHLLR